jgi:hypothetical protein
MAEHLAGSQQDELNPESVGAGDRRGERSDHDGQQDELSRRGAGRGSAARSGVRGGGKGDGQRAGSQPPQWDRG